MADFDERLAALIARVLPGAPRLVSARRLSAGATQETYRVEVERDGAASPALYCLRRGTGGLDSAIVESGLSRPGLAVEARLFRIVREVGVPGPEVLYVLEEADGLGHGFLMEWIEGETLGARIVRAKEFEAVRPSLARLCGEVLARIHSVDVEATGLDRELRVVSTEAFVRDLWTGYRAYGTAMPMIDYTARWLLERLPPEEAPRLVHNDFRNGNLIIGPDGVRAVLDWELAHLGDPVRDLGWICTNSWRFGRSELPVGGFGHREDLLEGYAAVSGRRIDPDHLRFWEVFGSFWWAVGSLQGAAVWRSGPDPTVERPGIARRSSECQMDCANHLIPGPVTLVEAQTPASSVDMPSADELLVSVRDFLREDVRAAARGRNSFLALVASNSLDIVRRELSLGPAHRDAESARLRALLGVDEPLATLRERLCEGLRDETLPLDLPGLADHLRTTVANQLAIDQPRYSGLATALADSSPP